MDSNKTQKKILSVVLNLAADMGVVKKDVSTLKQDVSELKQDVSVLKQDVSGLKQDVSGLKQDVSGLKQDVSGLKQDVSGLKQDVSGIKQNISGLEKNYTGLKQALHSLKTTVESNHIETQEQFSLMATHIEETKQELCKDLDTLGSGLRGEMQAMETRLKDELTYNTNRFATKEFVDDRHLELKNATRMTDGRITIIVDTLAKKSVLTATEKKKLQHLSPSGGKKFH